jgi:acetyltransferase-like isoleucine patch superfamily enzyme
MMRWIAKLRGSWLRFKFRAAGNHVRIGTGLEVYRRLDIRGKGKVIIGKNCKIGGIRGDQKQYVTLYTLSPDSIIRIGDEVSLYASRISAKFSVTIASHVHMEEAGITDTNFHSLDKKRESPRHECKEKCEIIIGEGVYVGACAIITSGVRVGDHSVIAPGSIVARRVPPRSFVIGNPARILKQE